MSTDNLVYPDPNILLDCGHPESPHSSFTSGYGMDRETGKKSCYACCAEEDKKFMQEHGRITLYLVLRGAKYGRSYYVTNWPESLEFGPLNVRIGRHNLAGRRYDVWFVFDGYWWHGVQYGDNTELCHCKRTKERFIPTP